MTTIQTSNLGYPRIGENREWKKALEAFWKGQIAEEELYKQLKEMRLSYYRKQRDAGIDLVPVGDFTAYDHMLDLSAMFGLVPGRFPYAGGKVDLATYFAMARGTKEAAACEMTKWFNTNYHYIVPEIGQREPKLTHNRPLEAYLEAKEELSLEGKPVMVGPYTFLKCAKGYASSELQSLLMTFAELYGEVLKQLEQAGVVWVQLDEPALVLEMEREELVWVKAAYERMAEAAPGLNLILQTYFDSVHMPEQVFELPVQAFGLDFVHGRQGNMAVLRSRLFPQDKKLAIGIIDGRNIWRSDLAADLELLREISGYITPDRWIIQPSCSLLHVPVTVKYEQLPDPIIQQALAFADEKLAEVVVLSRAYTGNASAEEAAFASRAALLRLNQSPSRRVAEVVNQMEAIDQLSTARTTTFEERYQKQLKKLQLPPLPTTTIGSFPQTAEVRKARRQWKNGQWTEAQYQTFIQEQIREWVDIQENLGLDVLVHGEFERNDMVEFFGERLSGFTFTQNGWVQSYGSRCTKPPIIYGDVSHDAAMTLQETLFARSLTHKPIKGMLTGPVTILAWSFVRNDIPERDVAYQIALALREEVSLLEQSGIHIIQVDEPAIRELTPLKRSEWDDYFEWAVKAFKLCTSHVKDETQIHTHMCYAEFHQIIDVIKALDADVISIETSRSHGELIHAFQEQPYEKGIGLGVYDIHSPRVPEVQEMLNIIEESLKVLPPDRFWVNPDCGLKTRNKEETAAALSNMVQAAKEARKQLSVKV
ncbi:5-methyltetrahydropteroyltriglutamate--homocysteine S-methyltransferase [Marinicrinis lubricantis]|uniref:5-methyltetrahydropteroyltriglutamate--homocysteine methyltransferase n=1 Tax=Marinicrinis lubricantis TaxID=2086470 RepID=A0ABW1ILQ4_9BACL